MGILSFSEQTASADRNQAREKWADVKDSRVLEVRAGSPHYERLRAGWEAHTTKEHVQAGKPTLREITCRLGSPHYERACAGWEAHTTKDYVQAEESTQRKRTCGLEARTTRDYVRYRRANKKSP